MLPFQASLNKLGVKPGAGTGPFDPKPPFWEKPGYLLWCTAAVDPEAEEARFAAAAPVYADVKKNYDQSRRTITRTSEVQGIRVRVNCTDGLLRPNAGF